MNKFSTSTRRGAQVFYKNGDELDLNSTQAMLDEN
jgi:hypothetical protein